MKRAIPVVVLALSLAGPIPALPAGAEARRPPAGESTPLTQDPLGPLVDVTGRWQRFQPARAFCIRPNVFEASGDDGATATGRRPACRRSGFPRAAEGLYVVRIRAPRLCAGCRRLFLDYSAIPPENDPPVFYARGHAYFRLHSSNHRYTVDPLSHSPNIKNLTNDKLVAPAGSPQELLTHAFDLHAMAYVGDTAHFAHSSVQGPWYIGPWYVNRRGERIRGAYLDVDVTAAEPLPDPALNEIVYMAGFNSGEATCPDNVLADGAYADGNYFYGGCADHRGMSSEGLDPYR